MSETTIVATTPANSPIQTLPLKVAKVAGGEGAGQHLALEADVDDARAFGPKARQAGEDQRHAEANA